MSYPVWHPFTEMSHFNQNPLILTKGSGVYVYDDKNNGYLDVNAGLWSVSLGYGRTDILEEMMSQASAISCVPLFDRAHQPAIDYAHKLLAKLNGDFSMMFYTSGGSEAIETAMKISRTYHILTGHPQKSRIGHLKNSYHGVSLGALSVMGIEAIRSGIGPLPPDTFQIPLPSKTIQIDWTTVFKDIQKHITEQQLDTVAAIILEPIIAAGGIIPIPNELIHQLKQFCAAHNILLILDEIVTGFGRTGALFAYQETGIVPDMVVVGKGITSGYAPLGGVLVIEPITAPFKVPGVAFNHGFTQGGHVTACAAASKTLDILEQEEIFKQVKNNEEYFLSTLQTLMNEFDFIEQVRGRGYLYGIKIADAHDAMNFAPLARKHGVLFRRPAEDNVIPIGPPLIANREVIDEITQRLRKIFSEYHARS